MKDSMASLVELDYDFLPIRISWMLDRRFLSWRCRRALNKRFS
jgi:hypothetical protein